MKRVLIAAFLFIWACSRGNRTDPYRTSPDFEVRLSRTVCYGTCPAYELTIRGDGSVTFDGKDFVAAVGRHEKRIDTVAVRRLAGEFAKAGFFDIPHRPACPASSTDSPSATVTLTAGGRKHSVEHDYGCSETPLEKLTSLEAAIDDAASIQSWRRYDPLIRQRQVILNRFDVCADAAACETAARDLSRGALAVYEELEHDTFTTRRAIVCRDGVFWLRDTSFRFVRAMTGRLTLDELEALSGLIQSPAAPLIEVPDRKVDPLLTSTLAIPRNDTLEVTAYDALTAPANVRNIDALLHEVIVSRRFIGRSLHVTVDTAVASGEPPIITESWPADARPLIELQQQPAAGYEILKLFNALHVDRTSFGEPPALAGERPSWLVIRADDAPYRPLCQ